MRPLFHHDEYDIVLKGMLFSESNRGRNALMCEIDWHLDSCLGYMYNNTARLSMICFARCYYLDANKT